MHASSYSDGSTTAVLACRAVVRVKRLIWAAGTKACRLRVDYIDPVACSGYLLLPAVSRVC